MAKKKRRIRYDDYTNMVNKYGTKQDQSEHYVFQGDAMIPDETLTINYESNGLFAKIIDRPAEEAVKHGFNIDVKNKVIEKYLSKKLDALDWETKSATALKWTRLYGGALIVMLVDDGKDIDEKLDWENVRSIDELRVYDRTVVQPDQSSLYDYGYSERSRFGEPEYYDVYSMYGQFRVHESRCLVFKNGTLPEKTTQTLYRYWGIPEYLRIKRALRETVTSHGSGVKLLERCVQAIYKMKGLAATLAQEGGDEKVLQRIETIDIARGILNSILVDADGEDWDYKSIPLAGIKDILDSTCNMLSAVSDIPQTILFGRSPAGQNSTGDSDFENYYNMVERIQKQNLKSNGRTLLDLVFLEGVVKGKLSETPDYELKFKSLRSLNETEQATVDNQNANTELIKAQTAQVYVDMQAMDHSEVREGLKEAEKFNVEDLLNDVEDDTELLDLSTFNSLLNSSKSENYSTDSEQEPSCVGILVIKNGMILIGRRDDGQGWCGPGGKIEAGETPEDAAIREASEEFNILLNKLTHIDTFQGLESMYGIPVQFLCTDFEGDPVADGVEMTEARFVELAELFRSYPLFHPFKLSLMELLNQIQD